MALIDGVVAGSAAPSEAAPTEQLFYEYSTVDSAKRTFRLLILRGGTGHDINCELIESTIDGKGLPYEAVSYTWGPGFTTGTVNINGKKLPVTFNLSLILRDLRYADVDRLIWVDAICINQQDATEKGHQVAQMQDIFALAERVLFCIAQPTVYTDLLLGSLETLQDEIQNNDLSDDFAIDACWNRTQTAIALYHLNSQPQPSAEIRLSAQLEAMILLQRQGLEWILGQPWFHRVCILQEVANARDALVYCGQKSVSAAVFALGARLLGYSLPDKERHKTVNEVLNLMPGLARKDPSQDILSLFRKFGKANASVERDRIYALFGVCKDRQIQMHITPDYIKSEREVIIDTIAYICHCEVSVIATIPYISVAHFLSDLDYFDDTLLSHFLRLKNHKGALSVLQRHGHSISVTSDMLDMAVDDTMMKEGVMSRLLEQRNAGSLLSGQDGWKPLLFAAEHGYDTLVRKMVEKGAFIEARNTGGYDEERKNMTPLFLAAMNGHETVVKILLGNGANVSEQYSIKGTPLAWAARNGHSSIVQLLVEKGSDIEYDGLENRTPLSWAASKGYESIVRLLLKHGADPSRTSSYEYDTPLSRAAEKGHRAMVQILLENSDKFDRSSMEFALVCAARAAQLSIVSLLLSAGVSINLLNVLDAMVDFDWEGDDRREDFQAIVMMLFAKGAHFRENSNPLGTAAAAGNEWIVRLFLDYGAKVNYMGRLDSWYDGTALAFAIRYGHKNLAELLLAKGAHLEARDSCEQTPLFVAVRSGHEDIVKMLLEKGADIEVRAFDRTPLCLAARGGHENIVKMLLAEGADTETRDDGCNTPLMGAADEGHENIARALLENGANIEVRNSRDQTSLCLAARKGHENTVRLLLENGANIEVRDYRDQTPLCLAAKSGHEDTVRVLLENGADIEVRVSPYDWTPLCLAAGNGHKNTVRVLLENGADIEHRDYGIRTPLHFAAYNAHKNVVEVLLESGADIEAKDFLRYTPLIWASRFDHEDVVTLLLESGANPDIDLSYYTYGI